MKLASTPTTFPLVLVPVKILGFFRDLQFAKWALFFFAIYVVIVIKIATFRELNENILFGSYSILVAGYILSRFLITYFYKPVVATDTQYEPTISFVTPAKNEEDYIEKTLRCMLESDYPRAKMEIIVVNDGSTDGTLQAMMRAKEEASKRGIAMAVVDWQQNKGKREAMAEGARLAKGEIVLFIDSDSFVHASTARESVKYFVDRKVAAVSGHADVHNASTNLLTKMQAVRYFIAFRVYKGAEALFGSVTCCSGCSAAYRREYLMEVVEPWLQQRFLGGACTFGDDRSLTNFLLKKWKIIYAPEAKVTTVVPDTWRVFLRQQVRWKKSWTRESLRAAMFMWKKHPIMALSFFIGLLLPLLAPIIVLRALFWLPFTNGITPWFYLFGIVLMAFIYGLYYHIHRKDGLWAYGMVFVFFYVTVLIWQLPYAILTLRNSKWGTR